MMMNAHSRDHAVVLGGSMAGLLAARVLADRYAEVTVVERDELPTGCAHRRGVPHGRQAHALLARGQQALEELFPGLTAELVAHGAPTGDAVGDVRQHLSGHLLRQADSGLLVVSVSRPFLEHHVRARVRALPRVTFLEACDVVGLAGTSDRRRVTGARVLRRADGSAEEVLDADLVVDATGRGSRAPVWLETLGYPRPDEERVPIELGYTSRCYRMAADALGGNLACLSSLTPAHPRGGVLARLEDDQWMLTLAGVFGDHPPTDPDGFLAFARSLRIPDIHDTVRDAEPLTDPVAFRFPASVRRRYERLARFPDGFLVVGDGGCSFNPVYGQGMTVAALEALTLRSHLRRSRGPQPRRFLRDVARVIDAPWDIATGADRAFPGTGRQQTRQQRMAGAYISRLHAAAAHDARLASAFAHVSGLVDRPESLLRPRVALRVLRHHLRPRARTPSSGQTADPQR